MNSESFCRSAGDPKPQQPYARFSTIRLTAPFLTILLPLVGKKPFSSAAKTTRMGHDETLYSNCISSLLRGRGALRRKGGDDYGYGRPRAQVHPGERHGSGG